MKAHTQLSMQTKATAGQDACGSVHIQLYTYICASEQFNYSIQIVSISNEQHGNEQCIRAELFADFFSFGKCARHSWKPEANPTHRVHSVSLKSK